MSKFDFLNNSTNIEDFDFSTHAHLLELYKFHSLLSTDSDLKERLDNRDYRGVITDGCLILVNSLKERFSIRKVKISNFKDDKDYISAAFACENKSKPILKANGLRSVTEKDIQHGYYFMAISVFKTYRNPLSHEKKIICIEECCEVLSIISNILRYIDQCDGYYLTKSRKNSSRKEINIVNYVLYERAKKLVIDLGHCSINIIAGNLDLNAIEAKQLIDELEKNGVVGAQIIGMLGREVLVKS